MRLALHAVVAACSLHTASALAVRFGGRPPPPDLTKIYKDTVAAGNEPGSAAERPINKRKVVVCGAGGEAGRFIFGYVQRAAQTFESGLTAPRALVGAARGSRALNVCLATSFILAYADESLVSRCDFRDDEIVKKRLDGCSMVVAPYRMRPQGAVTGNGMDVGPGPGGRRVGAVFADLRRRTARRARHRRRGARRRGRGPVGPRGLRRAPHAPGHEGPRDHKKMESERRDPAGRGREARRRLLPVRFRSRTSARSSPRPSRSWTRPRAGSSRSAPSPTARRRRRSRSPRRSTPRSSRRPS